jgi:cell division GTPase FtsZ
MKVGVIGVGQAGGRIADLMLYYMGTASKHRAFLHSREFGKV